MKLKMPIRNSWLFLCFLLFCSRPKDPPIPEPEIENVDSVTNVSVELLTRGDWVEDVRVIDQFLRFEKNGQFSHKISFEGCGASNGRFQIDGHKIFFFDIQEVKGCTPWFSDKTTCHLVNTPNDLDFTEYLKCKANGAKKWPRDFKFANRRKPQKAGAIIKLNGVLSVALNPKPARISENAVFRNQPSVDAARAFYRESVDCSNGSDKEQSYLPKGQKISILAQTKEKATVDKWHNYWYYVCPITCEVYMGDGCYFRGWIYGEFVRK